MGGIDGWVYDYVTGQPIAYARVVASLIESDATMGSDGGSALTRGDGWYSIDQLKEGSFQVDASAIYPDYDEYEPQSTSVGVSGGAWTQQNFSLQRRPGTFYGTVTDDYTSLPLEGATVTLVGQYDNYSVPTDINGYYEVEVYADPAGYMMQASKEGYETSTPQGPEIVEPGASSEVNFELHDNTPPEVTILTPIDYGTTVEAYPLVTLRVSDNGSGIDPNSIYAEVWNLDATYETVYFTELIIDDQAPDGRILSARAIGRPLSPVYLDGWHYVIASAYDMAGNTVEEDPSCDFNVITGLKVQAINEGGQWPLKYSKKHVNPNDPDNKSLWTWTAENLLDDQNDPEWIDPGTLDRREPALYTIGQIEYIRPCLTSDKLYRKSALILCAPVTCSARVRSTTIQEYLFKPGDGWWVYANISDFSTDLVNFTTHNLGAVWPNGTARAQTTAGNYAYNIEWEFAVYDDTWGDWMDVPSGYSQYQTAVGINRCTTWQAPTADQQQCIYKEIATRACEWISASTVSTTKTQIEQKLLDGCWSLGSEGWDYVFPFDPDLPYRGLRVLLTEHTGACGEWAELLLHAMEINGVDAYIVDVDPWDTTDGGPLSDPSPLYWIFNTYQWAAVGRSAQNWQFPDHAFVISDWTGGQHPEQPENGTVYDPTYGNKNVYGWGTGEGKPDDGYEEDFLKAFWKVTGQWPFTPLETLDNTSGARQTHEVGYADWADTYSPQ